MYSWSRKKTQKVNVGYWYSHSSTRGTEQLVYIRTGKWLDLKRSIKMSGFYQVRWEEETTHTGSVDLRGQVNNSAVDCSGLFVRSTGSCSKATCCLLLLSSLWKGLCHCDLAWLHLPPLSPCLEERRPHCLSRAQGKVWAGHSREVPTKRWMFYRTQTFYTIPLFTLLILHSDSYHI